MSGICGIVNFDGKPVDHEKLRKMTEYMAYRGPDGINYWIEDNVGLVHLALNTTPESLREKQPLISKSGNLVLIADARVDNRNDLIPELKNRGYLKDNAPPDADLILAAYECWGEECAKHIIGDFALAIWNSSTKKLFIARDVVGIRQLFYSIHENSLYFASAAQPIAHALPEPPSLNIQLIDGFLRRFYDLWACQTIYNGILRLPPANYLIAKKGSMKRKLYYVFGQQKYNYSSDEEWKNAFLELFDEVLQNQLRSITPVGIWASGGLDSSSLACQVYELRKKNPDLPDIKLISAIFEGTPSQDEKHYFDALAEHCKGTSAKLVKCDDCWSFCELGTDGGFPLDEPEIWELRGYTSKVIRATTDSGCRVYFTGNGSDDLFGLNFYYQPTAIRDIEFGDFLREFKYFRQKGRINGLELIFRAYLLPLIPEGIRFQVWKYFNRDNWELPWLKLKNDLEFNKCEFEKTFLNSKRLGQYGNFTYKMIRAPMFIATSDLFGVMNANAGIELRQPYLDRRMIEFLMSIPSHLRSFRGVDRVLLRESMNGILPEKIRLRKDKTSAAALQKRGFYRESERIEKYIHNSNLEKMGIVNSEKINEAFNQLWDGEYEYIGYLRWFITLEAWLGNYK